MLTYLLTIFISMAVIAGGNIVFATAIYSLSPLYIIVAVLLSTIAVFGIDAVIAFVVHKLPAKYFNPYLKIYKVYGFERGLYERLGIRQWKDKIPEMGQLCDFKKDRIISITDNTYLYRFLVETCYAEVLHVWSGVLGFAIILMYPLKYAVLFGIPVASINLILQVLPVMIQRYTRPKLLKIYERNMRQTQVSAAAEQVA